MLTSRVENPVEGYYLKIVANGPPADYRCSHSIAMSGNQWADEVRLSDLEAGFVCSVCGKRGADVRPDFNWNKKAVGAMCYR